MATVDHLSICHRIMDLCAKLSAQKVGIFSFSYSGIADMASVHAYQPQGYEAQSLEYIEGWTSTDEGNTVFLGEWYDDNYGEPGECIVRLRILEAKLEALLITDSDGIPV